MKPTLAFEWIEVVWLLLKCSEKCQLIPIYLVCQKKKISLDSYFDNIGLYSMHILLNSYNCNISDWSNWIVAVSFQAEMKATAEILTFKMIWCCLDTILFWLTLKIAMWATINLFWSTASSDKMSLHRVSWSYGLKKVVTSGYRTGNLSVTGQEL